MTAPVPVSNTPMTCRHDWMRCVRCEALLRKTDATTTPQKWRWLRACMLFGLVANAFYSGALATLAYEQNNVVLGVVATVVALVPPAVSLIRLYQKGVL